MFIGFLRLISLVLAAQEFNNVNNFEDEIDLLYICNVKILKTLLKNMKIECKDITRTQLASLEADEEFFKGVVDMTQDLDLTENESKIIEKLQHPEFELKQEFIRFLGCGEEFKEHDYRFIFNFFLRSLKTYFDLSKSEKIPVNDIKRDILNYTSQLCYAIGIKVPFQENLKHLKDVLKDSAMFYIKDNFIFIEIIRICIDFNQPSEHLFPIIILDAIKEYFTDSILFVLKDGGEIVFNPNLKMIDPRLPYCVSLEVKKIILEEDIYEYTFDQIKYYSAIGMSILKRTLCAYFKLLISDSAEPCVRDLKNGIVYSNSFSIIFESLPQKDNSLFHMPLFLLEVGERDNLSLFKESTVNPQSKKHEHKFTSEDFLLYSEEPESKYFYFQAKNSFEALLKESEEDLKENTQDLGATSLIYYQNIFEMLERNSKIASEFTGKLSEISKKLAGFDEESLTIKWAQMFEEIYDLPILYERIFE